MEELIPFTMLNDFIFCPASIYFHKMYDGVENLLFTGEKQIAGKALHKKIDDNTWTQSDVICSQSFESRKYGLYGKIDKYYPKKKTLVMRFIILPLKALSKKILKSAKTAFMQMHALGVINDDRCRRI